jgi:hypothetical protein
MDGEREEESTALTDLPNGRSPARGSPASPTKTNGYH